jgi:crotonobetainyl-CoA:carnitine CoA-transferase CaiB-like acyl-CoA transferase
MGNSHPNIVPYQDFPTADGYMIIAVGNDSQFAKCCNVLGKPEWGSDERFATNPQRVKHREELIAMMCAVTETRTTEAWIAAMEEAGVPCGPINSLDKVFADPQVQSRGMRIEMDHPLAGTVPLVANPIRMSESPVQYLRSPPTLGEHTDEVLGAWLSMGQEEVAALRVNRIV